MNVGSRPTDAEIRAHLEVHPELLDDPEVQEYLRDHPAADPRTSTGEKPAQADETTDQVEATAPPADDNADSAPPEETGEPPADADTEEVTASPNE